MGCHTLEELYEHLRTKIIELREKAGLSQAQLAV